MYYKIGKWLSDADVMHSPRACNCKRGNYNFAKPISKSKNNDNIFYCFLEHGNHVSTHHELLSSDREIL